MNIWRVLALDKWTNNPNSLQWSRPILRMANNRRLVREPYAKPSHADSGASIPSTCNTINFRHPGYDETSNILLSIPALDPERSLRHETARIACCILVDNPWEGFLTEDKEGQNRIAIPTNGTLTGRNYYFHVSTTYPGGVHESREANES